MHPLVARLFFPPAGIEHQRGVGRNDAAGTARAISERRRNNQRALAADFHGSNTLIPAGNHLALADRKFERLIAVH